MAFYPFAGNANDASGNQNHGFVTSTFLTTDRFGHANAAYEFNGSSSFIGFDTPPLTQVTNWSITAWLRPSSLNQQGAAVFVGLDNGSTGNGFGFGVAGGAWSSGAQLSGYLGGKECFDSGYTFTSTNRWHQIVMLQETGLVKFYVDGVPTGKTSTTVPLPPTAFRIGSETGTRYYSGAIDEVRLYNRALSVSEIQSLFELETQDAPFILDQPQPQESYLGLSATFNVRAWGAKPMSYQWYESQGGSDPWLPLADGTNATLLLTNCQAAQNGNTYFVAITNSLGATTSSVVKLKVTTAYDYYGLVGYYTLNGNASDSSDSANDGTVYSATPTTDRFGHPNSAYSFDGSKSYISFSRTALTQTNNWSISAWLRPNSTNQLGAAVFVGYNDGYSGNGYGFGLASGWWSSGAQLFGFLGGRDSLASGYTFTSTVRWHHIVMCQETGLVKFYVDGVPTANTSPSVPQMPTSFRIGSEVGTRYFNGAVDDVRLYNRALSASDVQFLYNLESQSAPVFAEQPASTAFYTGSNVTFSVTVWGNQPLGYQWYRSDSISAPRVAIDGATNSILNLLNCPRALNGSLYYVIASNALGTATSQVARLDWTPYDFAGLIAHYSLNGNAQDIGGSNWNGTLHNVSGTANSAGIVNHACSFNGNNSWIELPGGVVENLSSGTISLWVRPRQGQGVLMVKQHDGWGQYPFLGLGESRDAGASNHAITPFKLCYSANTSSPQLFSSNNLPSNVWSHVAVVFDGNAATLYLNGVRDASALGDWNVPADGNPLALGKWLSDGSTIPNTTLNGDLDEVRFHNRALSPEEIVQLYGYDSHTPPVIITSPSSQVINVDASVRFSVGAAGEAPLSCQWFSVPPGGGTGAPIADATNSTLQFLHCQLAQSGTGYYAVLTNALGAATSAVAQLTVTTAFDYNGLVGYYPFNGNAEDASSFQNSSIVAGATLAPNMFGISNRAYYFSGNSTYIGFTKTPLAQTDNWTLSAWLRPDSLNQLGAVVLVGTDDGYSGTGFGFGVAGGPWGNSGNQLYGFIPGVGWVDGAYTFNTTNRWHQVVMVRRAGVIKFYVDGVATSTASTMEPLMPAGFRIGSETGTRYFKGSIDQVRVYNRPLTDQEIPQLYALETQSIPYLLLQPQSQEAFVGSNTSFSVTAFGTQPISYQWYAASNGNPASAMPGETNASLQLQNCQPWQDASTYFVVATNLLGATTSQVAVLKVTTVYTRYGLVAYYPFNGNAKDQSVQGLDGQVTNATLTADRFGADNRAYVFGDASSFINFAAPPLTQTDNWSIAAWIRPDAFNYQGLAVLVGYDDGRTGDGFGLGVNNNGMFGAFFGGIGWVDSGFTFASTRQWHHVVLLSEGGLIKFYIDGVQGANSFYRTPAAPSHFRIGCDMWTRSFGGAVDEVRIYNRPLTPQDVRELYAMELISPPIISVQPESQTNYTSFDAGFNLSIGGTAPLSCQWWHDGSAIPLATNSQLLITNCQARDAGDYQCVITNIYGSVTSQVATLTLQPLPLPIITDQPASTNILLGTTLRLTVAATNPGPLVYQWLFLGNPIPNATNATFRLPHITSDQAGTYAAIIANAAGMVTSQVATVTVRLPVMHYVSTSSPNPVPPYLTWATAAHTIQAAIDVSLAADIVWVTNGYYAEGGRAIANGMTNRLTIDRAIRVQSVNGPAQTVIAGQPGSGGGTGPGAVRCAYVGTNAYLSGFTLTNGYTTRNANDTEAACGGGAWCESKGTLTNCVLANNSAFLAGGGMYSGNADHCQFMDNISTVGGGASETTLVNCLLTGNTAYNYGGGADHCHLIQCTVADNFAIYYAGGLFDGQAENSIIYYNRAFYYEPNCNYSAVSFSCASGWFWGNGNIDSPPNFVNLPGRDFHLLPTSPCIDAGYDAYLLSLTDLDGKPRVKGAHVDMGAYESDFLLSRQPVVQKVSGSGHRFGLQVDWSETNRLYRLQFKTNLLDKTWTPLNAWLSGNGSNIGLFDPEPTNGVRFYRLESTDSPQ